MKPRLTPLEPWIAEKIGVSKQSVTRQDIEAWQTSRLRTLINYAKSRSPFYAEHLKAIKGEGILSLSDLPALPLMDEEDLRLHGQRMLCVLQDDVARVITLQSSGTTGPAKRLFFSSADLELTLDFFHHGMSTFTLPKQRVLILLPGPTPDSTGQLLAQALERLGAVGKVYGLAHDAQQALITAEKWRADILAGFPVHVLAMARLAEASGTQLDISGMLLCSDYIPNAVVQEVERIWGCSVYSHWGTVETGLGGGVECEALSGCHLREADLLIEILDPDNGFPAPEGEWGELAVTTLTREAMPLIRYRTGDLGRLLPEPCICGSVLKRLDKIQGRINQITRLPNGKILSMAVLDEALLGLPGVLDFQASLEIRDCSIELNICLATLPGQEKKSLDSARESLSGLPEFHRGSPVLNITAASWENAGLSPAKRTLALGRSERC